MATWYDLTFIYKQLLTYQQMTKLAGNITAFAEGAGGAPRIQVAAIGNDQITADKLGHNIDGVSIGFNADKLDGSHLAGISGTGSLGQYVGDGTANRIRPHGLGVIPKFLLITAINTGHFFRINGFDAYIYYQHQASGGKLAVTAVTTTNFYIGNAASYPFSANENAITYYWVAIG